MNLYTTLRVRPVFLAFAVVAMLSAIGGWPLWAKVSVGLTLALEHAFVFWYERFRTLPHGWRWLDRGSHGEFRAAGPDRSGLVITKVVPYDRAVSLTKQRRRFVRDVHLYAQRADAKHSR